ncbi:MAG: sirohydrochlorin chelatase [Planctomycetaceae bacterium]|nr:sirohydrochlorin chelatase [Planctomycetaceae bacterium]
MVPFDSGAETGILVVGHGSRDPGSNLPLPGLCREVALRLRGTPVQPCYLELARPTIDEGLTALSRRGVTRTIVVPLLLTAGRHVRFDIPSEVGRSLARLSNMLVCFTAHLGSHPQLVSIANSRLAETLDGRPARLSHTKYVLVARGSRDPLVRGEVSRWAASRRFEDREADFLPCFLSLTQPTLDDGLQRAMADLPARIVVQPHLLYPGRLLSQIRSRVERLGKQFPHIEWVSVGALGPDPRLVDCVLDLAVQASGNHFTREAG